MKYKEMPVPTDLESRKALNEKVLYLIDSNTCEEYGVTPEDIYNAYTGDGGLHGLNRADFSNYHEYSEKKKEFENGQVFTPPKLCQLLTESLRVSRSDLIVDLTCGKGSFFNFFPVESNLYGCELDTKAYKVARYLYPNANITLGDIRSYAPEVRFDCAVGNPPFNLRWNTEDGEILSQLYYCLKAAQVLKPLGILALIVPSSFLADEFSDKAMIHEMEKHVSFLGQIGLPENAFAAFGVERYATKLQFWQKNSTVDGWTAKKYTTGLHYTLPTRYHVQAEQQKIYDCILTRPKAELEKNRSHVLLELARSKKTSDNFTYEIQKMLYQIKVHPRLRDHYAKCCEYLHRFYTETQPKDMSFEEWQKKRITEATVLSYLRRTLKKQVVKPERDVIVLVKQEDQFVYKGYSSKTRRQLMLHPHEAVPVYQAVLENEPGRYPGFERFLRRKRKAYETQEQQFADMTEDADVGAWLNSFSLWDAENEETIHLNPMQKHDINLMLQKRYGLLQWEQGSGKTLTGIAVASYRMAKQHIHSTWVISSAISIRNNWDVVLPNYGLSYVFVEKLKDLERIKPGDFVLLTLNKLGTYRRQIAKWMKLHHQKVQLVLDESDEISNPSTVRAKAALQCFRRCWGKLLTTGTSTRNNISEFAPQLELLYNNSINMMDWCSRIYHYDKELGEIAGDENKHYGKPIPAYKKGYSLFSSCHLPEKTTVFGIGERNQDIYNADALNNILGKTVITRTFEEITGKEIRRIHQVPMRFAPEEFEVYKTVVKEFQKVQGNYFASTGNSKKDAMLRLVQQITLLLRVSAAPNTMKEYEGDTPVKIMAAVEMAAQWGNEVVAIGVRHKNVLDAFADALREYLPDRPLFIVTGSTTTFAQRRKLHNTLKESGNGILLCTQQSLPSSVNFEFVDKILIPELHYNNTSMSQFYMRFIRYTSTQYKDIYFLTYSNSLESNLMQMVLCKEKINLFMKGKDADMDEIYEKFGVDYNLLAALSYREKDADGHFQIRWGEQLIA